MSASIAACDSFESVHSLCCNCGFVSRGQAGWDLGQSDLDSVYQSSIGRAIKAKARPMTVPPKGPAMPDEDPGQSQDDSAAALPSAKFLARSTYSAGFCAPVENKRLEKDLLMPSSKNGLRKRPAFLSGSTYSGTYENSVEIYNGQGWMEEKHRKQGLAGIQSYATPWREVVAQPSRGHFDTFYSADYGRFGDGQSGQMPKHPLGFSQMASTAALFRGTNKQYARVPGYTGFLPESGANRQATLQAQDHKHRDSKDCRLFTLNQMRLAMPGTMSFQPQDAANLIKPSKGKAGTAATFMNAYMNDPKNLEALALKRAGQKSFGTKNGTLSFFQAGTLTVSENGRTNAETFYKLLRPYEGLPRVVYPSETSDSGYKYGCYRDVV